MTQTKRKVPCTFKREIPLEIQERIYCHPESVVEADITELGRSGFPRLCPDHSVARSNPQYLRNSCRSHEVIIQDHLKRVDELCPGPKEAGGTVTRNGTLPYTVTQH